VRWSMYLQLTSTCATSTYPLSLHDALPIFRRHAYGGNDNNVYHVLLTSVDSELEMRFADYGASLNSDKGDVFSSVRRTMDRFELDRKSTRLNSSHVSISYAVFCLKKKRKVH